MLLLNSKGLLVVYLLYSSVFSVTFGAEISWVATTAVSTNSHLEGYGAEKVSGGVVSDAFCWLSEGADLKPWVELSFPRPTTVGMIDGCSGRKTGVRLKAFDVLAEVDGGWQLSAHGEVRQNTQTAKRAYIDPEDVSKVRLELLNPGAARISDISVYNKKEALLLKDIDERGNEAGAFKISLNQHQIGVNQIDYFKEHSKRFIASAECSVRLVEPVKKSYYNESII